MAGRVMDVVGAAFDADGIMPTADEVYTAFFDLRSGLGGELFWKVTNYGLRLALVLRDPVAHGPHWQGLVFEHGRRSSSLGFEPLPGSTSSTRRGCPETRMGDP